MLFRFEITGAILAFSITMVSCVKDVIMDVMEDSQVVVECVLTDEPVQTLYLTYTKGASREAAPELLEATASLTDLSGSKEIGRFKRTPDGSWILEYTPLAKHRYRLDVSVPGHDPIWAEQTMPEAPGIEVGWQRWDPMKNCNNVGYVFRWRDPADPVWFYGINYSSRDSGGELTPSLRTNSTRVDAFNEKKGRLFSEDLWGLHKSAVFRTTYYPNLEKAPLYSRYLRFPVGEDQPESEFMVSGSFRGYISGIKDFVHAEIRPAELHYLSASEDYDRFLHDSAVLMENTLSSNMADIFVRDNAYSNIHGAIGIFGAKVERMLEWEGRDSWDGHEFFLLASFIPSLVIDLDNHTQSYVTHNLKKFSNAIFCPFELIHFEFWIGERPGWAPSHGISYVTVVENEVQLDACGFLNYPPVDFSKKKILTCVQASEIPVLIGYGEGMVPGKRAPIMGITQSNVPCGFRYALLVDKEDDVATGLIDSDAQIVFRDHVQLVSELAEGLAANLP